MKEFIKIIRICFIVQLLNFAFFENNFKVNAQVNGTNKVIEDSSLFLFLELDFVTFEPFSPANTNKKYVYKVRKKIKEPDIFANKEIKIYKNGIIYNKIFTDNKGRINLIFNPGIIYRLVFDDNKELLIDTRKVTNNPKKNKFQYSNQINTYSFKDLSKVSNVRLGSYTFNKYNLEFKYTPLSMAVKSDDLKEVGNNITEIKKPQDQEINKTSNGVLEQNGGSVKINLSIRATNGNEKFENCPILSEGIVYLSDGMGNTNSAILNTNNPFNMVLLLNPGISNNFNQNIIQIDCPNFFKKKIVLQTNDLKRGKNQTNIFDTINVLLDSCFINENKIKYENKIYDMFAYHYEFKFGKLKKLEAIKLEDIKRKNNYLKAIKEAQLTKNEFYKIKADKINEFENNLLFNNLDNNKQEVKYNKEKSKSKTAKSIEKEIISVQKIEKQLFKLDSNLNSTHTSLYWIFKNQPIHYLPKKLRNDFQRFGFDTMPIYVEREVEKHLKDIIDASKNINTMQDTLNLYMHLYQLNKDFIYVGNKRISEIAGKSERQLLLVEILKVINEKELENYSIRKEVRELHLKLDAKSVLLKFERYKLIFFALVALFLLIIIYNKYNQYKKLKGITVLLNIKNKEVKDSIQYAQRIQFAILPTKENIAKAFPQSFVLFKPKDIVSGDFYWFQEIENKKYIAACDCTGHGVPGALMSMVATDMLNDALVHTKKVDEILALTNRSIKTALKQSSDDDSTRDGMDLALCCFDENTNRLQYAGAYRPLWLIRHAELDSASSTNAHDADFVSSQKTESVGKIAAQGRNDAWELIEYKATKAAIGGLTEDNQVFQLNEIQLQKGDTIYLSSDGYADQFSPADKKLMTKRFKEILLSIQHLTMPEQGNYLSQFITDWRGNMEQTDDVLVIGVRV